MTKATANYRQEKTHMMGAADRSFTDQSTLQEDERLGLSFMDAHGYSPRGDQRSGVAEASSLLGGSPRRPCGRKGSPYHTGQLHPAVRVADLLQHISQMKTAEGYGFQQEEEGGSPPASARLPALHAASASAISRSLPDLKPDLAGSADLDPAPACPWP
ncbi:Receptor-type tyrosine-protein phosphatase U [Tupaia chinensis]|uniref:Receptor-type tyrosine-protein phosphatase U n=1 Tax=Tupaia chinensis TaxID=246437 RepID=L8Y8J6_TUPCH|nr:Receptor-type tyrosine-protein phosphatase U [Tupaia chinensis]